MSIELKISADNATELHGLILGLAGISKAPVGEMIDPRIKAEEPKAETKPAKARRSPEKEPAPAAEAPEAPVEEPKVEEPKATPEAPVASVEYADVQKAVGALAAAKTRDAVIKVLDGFGVDHAKKLEPSQWAEAVAALKAALED